MEKIFLLKNKVLFKKRVTHLLYQISDSRDRQKTDKIQKGHQKFWELKWKFFPKKVIRKFGPRKIFPSPKLGAKSPPMFGTLVSPRANNLNPPPKIFLLTIMAESAQSNN